MRRPLLFAAFPGSVAAGAVACALAGCPTTAATTTYTPITGIRIPSGPLVAGHGCGPGPTQVYRYLAVVVYADDAGAPLPGQPPVASQVFDCYTDGIFSNLPASASGSSSYAVAIYAWNKDSFPAALTCINAPCPAEDFDADVQFLDAGAPAHPEWATTCTAMQQSGATQVAVCPCPLAPLGTSGCMDAAAVDGAAVDGAAVDGAADAEAGPAPGTITVSTTSFPLADGGTIRCMSNYEGALASYVATSDAGDAGLTGQTPWVPCMQPLVIANANPSFSYSIDVMLSSTEGGATVASTTCTASPSPGASTAAVCGPAKLGP